ncbi:LysR family transcriptional regulator [Bosea sp. (in: a-proteobacteria)]|uniref:LysR family transcriptional regulator n=1 Tax=Bosea sp. (in: a-proteobacteria) TaxID=1871050 RepID=UPI002FC71D53
MTDKSGEMELFVRAVGLGSFSSAARALSLTPSAVSKAVGRLEDRLGVQLLDRSTRSIRLTVEGQVYYRECLRLVGEIDELERTLGARRNLPHGRLRVNSSVPIARQHLLPILPEFLQRYPAIELDLSMSDEVVDLIDSRADVAVRIGPLQDSALRARKILDFRRIVVASPAYLARHGIPQRPADLASHNCLGFNLKSSLNEWPFVKDGRSFALPVSGNFCANNGDSLREFVLSGVGIARLASFMIGDDIREGRLVTLLDDYHPNDTLSVFAVFFQQKYMPARIRCFVDFLVERLGQIPEKFSPAPSAALHAEAVVGISAA